MISAWVSITLAPQSLEIEVALVSSSNCNFLMSLSEALPTTAITLCRNLHAEALQATVSEGLAKVPTWRLERYSNLPVERLRLYQCATRDRRKEEATPTEGLPFHPMGLLLSLFWRK